MGKFISVSTKAFGVIEVNIDHIVFVREENGEGQIALSHQSGVGPNGGGGPLMVTCNSSADEIMAKITG